jgi:hypothetical protein
MRGLGRWPGRLATFPAAEAIAVRRLDQAPQGRRVWSVRIPNTAHLVSGPPAADKKGLSQKEGLVTPPGLSISGLPVIEFQFASRAGPTSVGIRPIKHCARDAEAFGNCGKTSRVSLYLSHTRPWRPASLRHPAPPSFLFTSERKLTKLRRKTSRGNNDGWLKFKSKIMRAAPHPSHRFAVLFPLPANAGRGWRASSASEMRDG